jgi:hypothetical protein
LVELNSTLLPVVNQINVLVNTLKLLVGGVFGIYVILLYLRWREYLFTRKKLNEIQHTLSLIAKKQHITLPEKQKRIKRIGLFLKKVIK